MVRWGWTLLVTAFLVAGCTLSPEKKALMEQSLKQASDQFTAAVAQGDWASAHRMTSGKFANAEELEKHLKQPWDDKWTLTGGDLVSMAWLGTKATKVKVNWVFQQGAQQSFSSETFVWAWKDESWKYEGRTLR